MKLRRLIMLGLLLAGCTRSVSVPGVVVEVTSDLDVPAQLDSVDLRVRVAGAGADTVSETFALDPEAARHVGLPLDFGLYPKQGLGGRFSVTAIGNLRGQAVVWRSATVSFPRSGPTVVLPLPLRAACNGKQCDFGTTCQGAAVCLSDDVIVDRLEPYRKGGGSFMGEDDAAAADSAPPRRDGSPAPDSTAGGDTAGPDGVATADLAPAVDLAVPPDLTTPPDAQGSLDLGPPPDRSPLCTPAPEDCFNGVDDDCDNLADCADPDCVPATAQCVPIDLSTDAAAAPGVSVAANASCPVQFDRVAATTVRTGLTGGACTGCSCGASPTTCGPASVYTYDSAAACSADTGNTAGMPTKPPTLTAGDACLVPTYAASPGGFIYGLRVLPIPPMMGNCPASGMATPGPIAWASTTKFCPTTARGVGCGAGQVCVPKPPAPTIKSCVLYSGAHACPTGTTKLQNADWYTGSNDARGCSACGCVNPTGGSCAGLVVHVGNDYTCDPDDADVHPGNKTCFQGYTPGLQVNGAPSNGSCTPASAVTGALTPTGKHSICCL
jgi:hypothetical protein